MLKFGPVDVIVLAAGAPAFDGSILAELERAAETGVIRVLDAMLLVRDDAGDCWRVDIEDLPDDQKLALAFVETGTRGLFDSDDAGVLFEGMVPGSAVVALAIEHRWAIDLVNAVYSSGVELAFQFRVPAVVVDEAYASLSTNA
ncbi:MAG TPA: DUF6325 family protein [Anaerolineae bacterium]|nr:DUF6325 family protein [Anaerolineae bacterium]HNU05479.1 DUF6325 family protein [Anaerolineae bacterium]